MTYKNSRRSIKRHPDRYRADDPDRKFLQSRVWREKLRPWQLAHMPLCEHCQALGRTVPATQVDHIKRPKGDSHLQRNPENWQSLCHDHHLAKSNWERSGKKRPLILGIATDGYPIELLNGAIDRDRSFDSGGKTLKDLGANAQPVASLKRELVSEDQESSST